MKFDKVLRSMFLLAILGVDPSQNLAKGGNGCSYNEPVEAL